MAGKRSQHSRRMRIPQFNVSGKRPIAQMPITWIDKKRCYDMSKQSTTNLMHILRIYVYMKYVNQNKPNKWLQSNCHANHYNSCQAVDKYMLAISCAIYLSSRPTQRFKTRQFRWFGWLDFRSSRPFCNCKYIFSFTLAHCCHWVECVWVIWTNLLWLTSCDLFQNWTHCP